MALDSPPFWLISESCLCTWANKFSYSSSSSSYILPFFSQGLRLRTNLTIVAVAKKENKNINKRKKDDKHSFAPKRDEATGIFPEAVLLKERKVEEDGRRMPEFADVEERELFESLNLLLESDTNVDQMRHYEVVYLIHEDRKEEVENVNVKVLEFLKEKKGRLWRVSDWGIRRLAYSIKKAKNAHYILMNFEMEAKWINDFKSLLDRDERVIRHLVMKKDRAETYDCPPPPDFFSVHSDMNVYGEDLNEEYDDQDVDEDEDGEDDEGIIYVDDDQETSGDFSRPVQRAQEVGR